MEQTEAPAEVSARGQERGHKKNACSDVVWLYDQEPVRTFQKGPPPQKAKLRPWWTVHHFQDVKNECADYISRNNFQDVIGARSEELAREAFSPIDVHLDLNMTMIRPLHGLQQVEYLKEFGDIHKPPEKHLEPVLVKQKQWKREKTYLWHEHRIVVPSNRLLALLNRSHESSGHVGADRTLKLCKKWFHSIGVMLNYRRPSSPSWTSARASPVTPSPLYAKNQLDDFRSLKLQIYLVIYLP